MAIGRGTTNLIPLLVVVGPTASGKSDWVNYFAKTYNGEVVCADSRQIYKYFSIGTNKEKGEWEKRGKKLHYLVEGINYHLIDCLSPEADFSVYEYQKLASIAISDIYKRGHLACLSGGTGMYIDALVDNWKLTKDSFNKALREELTDKTTIELFRRLEKHDPVTARKIDKQNRTRLIRAVEIIELTGEPKGDAPKRGKKLYKTLKIGITIDRDKLYTIINKRTDKQIKEGLIEEVQELRKNYPKELPVFFSIGYKEIIEYLEGDITKAQAIENIKTNTRRYAKRQMTWWRRDKDIEWCEERSEGENLLKEFLKK